MWERTKRHKFPLDERRRGDRDEEWIFLPRNLLISSFRFRINWHPHFVKIVDSSDNCVANVNKVLLERLHQSTALLECLSRSIFLHLRESFTPRTFLFLSTDILKVYDAIKYIWRFSINFFFGQIKEEGNKQKLYPVFRAYYKLQFVVFPLEYCLLLRA